MNKRLRVSAIVMGACFATFALPITAASAAGGDVGYGVSAGGNRLVIFDPLNPSAAGQGVPIAGIPSGETVVSIDSRPSTGQLSVLTLDGDGGGRLYNVDPAGPTATRVGSVTIPLGQNAARSKFDIDFDPVTGQIRVVGSNTVNLEVNPDSGAVSADVNLSYGPNSGSIPHIAGAAYTGAAGDTTTTLYDIDFVADTLTLQGVAGSSTSANSGSESTVGPLGVDPTNLLGFDYSPRTGIAYLAAQVMDPSTFTVESYATMYMVNLATGTATPVAGGDDKVGQGSNTDILQTFCVGPAPVAPASLPDLGLPAAAAVVGLGIGAFAIRRRRAA